MLHGGAIPPPPPSPRARPHHPPMGGRRGADRTFPLSRWGASVHLEEELIQRRGGKKEKKKRRNTSSSPPHGDLISRNSSSNTHGTYESPQFFLKMSDLKPLPVMTLTKNTSVHYARWSIRLVVMIHKIHRFLFSFANIDFAEIASRI